MPQRFLDANPIIRYLTQDHPDHAARSRRLFERAAAGEFSLLTSESVLVEVVRVLSSPNLYNLSRPEVGRHLANVLALPGLSAPHKRTFLRALDLWASSCIDFVDGPCVAQMERLKIGTIASFDQDFDRFTQITREEP